MRVKFTGIDKENSLLKSKILSSVNNCLNTGDFILGKSVERFEKNFSKYVGSKYAVGVNSGSDALTLSLKAININYGDEIITCPNSYIATSWAIVAANGTPVFVDCNDEMNIDWKKIRENITKKTKAIIPTHLTGMPCDIDEIEKISKEFKIPIIYDCAQAIGSVYKNRNIGGPFFVSCFSLHPLKNLAVAGDGGVVTTNSKKIYDRIRMLRNHGGINRDRIKIWGYNSRLDNIHAEIANIKLKKLNSWIKHIRNIANYYTNELKKLVEVPNENSFKKSSYHLYIIKVKNKIERKKLMDFLTLKNIDVKIHYPIPIHLQECAKNLDYHKGDFPKVEDYSKRIISLPIHSNIQKKEAEYVVKCIKLFYRGN